MSEVMKRLKLNKFSLFLTLVIAGFAAFSTLFFALLEGVRNLATILFRVFISFAFFSVLGYFVSAYLENEYLQTLAKGGQSEEREKKTVSENETLQTEQNLTSHEPALVDSEQGES